MHGEPPPSPRAVRLREAGYKLTHARLTVLDTLERSGGHITSSELLDRVGRIDGSIGRASVFRALDLFTRLALIRPTYIDSSITPTYVLLPNGHHHHIICTVCSRVIEFEHCGLGPLTADLEAQLDVQLTGHLLEFYGVCGFCQRGETAPASVHQHAHDAHTHDYMHAADADDHDSTESEP